LSVISRALQEKQFEDRERELARKRQENSAAAEKVMKERSSTPDQTTTTDKKPAPENNNSSVNQAPQRYVPPHLRKPIA